MIRNVATVIFTMLLLMSGRLFDSNRQHSPFFVAALDAITFYDGFTPMTSYPQRAWLFTGAPHVAVVTAIAPVLAPDGPPNAPTAGTRRPAKVTTNVTTCLTLSDIPTSSELLA